MDIIPAIDIIDGCCVRLSKGNMIGKGRAVHTRSCRCRASIRGRWLKHLHMVDLDGRRAAMLSISAFLERIASSTTQISRFRRRE